MPATNALRMLAAAGVDHRVYAYDLPDSAFSAEAVADQIGLPRAQVFKTLLAHGAAGAVFAVVPAGTELDLKALAAAAGERKMAMVPVADLEPLTGYRRGAVTAIGARRHFPVFLDASAADHERVAVSAGARGLQVMLATADYQAMTAASLASIARTPAGPRLDPVQ